MEIVGWVVTICTIIGAVYTYINPSETVQILRKIETYILKEAPHKEKPRPKFLEFYQFYNDDEISNSHLRFYNPSPDTALKDLKIKLYQNGKSEAFYTHNLSYLAAESSDGNFDIKTKIRMSGDVTYCAEYTNEAGKRVTAITPLSAQYSDNMVNYKQGGDIIMSDKECDAAIKGR